MYVAIECCIVNIESIISKYILFEQVPMSLGPKPNVEVVKNILDWIVIKRVGQLLEFNTNYKFKQNKTMIFTENM